MNISSWKCQIGWFNKCKSLNEGFVLKMERSLDASPFPQAVSALMNPCFLTAKIFCQKTSNLLYLQALLLFASTSGTQSVGHREEDELVGHCPLDNYFWPVTSNAKELRKFGKERKEGIISQFLIFFICSHKMKKNATILDFFPYHFLKCLSLKFFSFLPSFFYAFSLLVSISVYFRKISSSYFIRTTAVLKSDASNDIMYVHCRSTAHQFKRSFP